MRATSQVCLDLVDAEGRTHGRLRVHLLPRSEGKDGIAPLLDNRADPERDNTMEPVQLIEGMEYRYQFVLTAEPPPTIDTDRPDVFEPDDKSGLTGRLRPRLFTGSLPVTVYSDGKVIGKIAFEVRSRKLEYVRHYRWMLRDIADGLTEVVMERFAASEQRFELDEQRDAPTLYQRFAFLKSLIFGDPFEAAIHQILARPHRAWVEEEEWRHPAQGVRGSSALIRQITAPGPRIPWGAGPIPSLPTHVQVQRTEETLDTPENRFVKFALTRWRDAVDRIKSALVAQARSAPVERGLREVDAVLERLDGLLSAELFREVGKMAHFPGGSQVLQKKAGYRDLFQAYIQFEAAASLTWRGGERVYGAGQRNVATLYEYWVFLQLARVVSALCSVPFDHTQLLEPSEDGLDLALRQGEERVLSGTVEHLGRRLHLELWFNRTFGRGNGGFSSWTRPMRPDCSLRIYPAPGTPAFEEVWLHFDAKYRVENLQGMISQEPVTGEEEEVPALSSPAPSAAKRDDLLKMHAYRDAIRRSAGAYVIYPGTDPVPPFRTYHEILPGLGAFALVPAEDGEAEGTDALREFIQDVVDHVASQVTQHERSRYWHEQAYADQYRAGGPVAAASFLSRPPADTVVLLGYVKNQQQLAWIHKERQYNVRASGTSGVVELGSRELTSELVLLYGPDLPQAELWRVQGEPLVRTKEELEASQYPKPSQDRYFCFQLAEIPGAVLPSGVSRTLIERIRRIEKPEARHGGPVATTWFRIVIETQTNAHTAEGLSTRGITP